MCRRGRCILLGVRPGLGPLGLGLGLERGRGLGLGLGLELVHLASSATVYSLELVRTKPKSMSYGKGSPREACVSRHLPHRRMDGVGGRRPPSQCVRWKPGGMGAGVATAGRASHRCGARSRCAESLQEWARGSSLLPHQRMVPPPLPPKPEHQPHTFGVFADAAGSLARALSPWTSPRWDRAGRWTPQRTRYPRGERSLHAERAR